MSSTPAVTTSSVSSVVAPNPIVGSAGGSIGFYGSAGAVQHAAIADLANDADGTEIATAVNGILATLRAVGLIAV